MTRYRRPIVNFVYRMIGDAGDADDVAQDVFVKAYRNIARYTSKGNFSTWLFALARNAAIDHLRWRRRHPLRPPDEPVEQEDTRSVRSEVTARETGKHIARAIAELPEDQRTAIILCEYHGMAYAEIAEVMNSSTKSVESRLYRAKQTLRRRLRHLLE